MFFALYFLISHYNHSLLHEQNGTAIISVAKGPSGPNDAYLFHLHTFLTNAAQHSSAAAHALEDHSGDVHTGQLTNMVTLLQTNYRPYFIFGAGSNEHQQLLLDYSDARYADTVQEVNELTEMLLVVPRRRGNGEKNDTNNDNDDHIPQSLHAGGGHSALLTNGGELYLWGWNDSGQLGRRDEDFTQLSPPALNVVHPLSDIKVEKVDLGHTHTLVIEKETGRVFGFGENGRGQVSGCADSDSEYTTMNHVPQTPIELSDEYFVDVAAGLFHSAAITKDGELITWGCGRFGQCLRPADDGGAQSSTVGRWHPSDGSKLIQVACGRRHTLVLDEHGRVWTLGGNKYGQLGRKSADYSASNTNTEPQLVQGPLGRVDSGCYAIHCGWSHILALCRENDSEACSTLYGWGRNDKGQLGTMPSAQQQQTHITTPQVLKHESLSIQAACCGAESSHILDIDGNIHSTGWNEHGNLAIGRTHDGSADSDCDECSMTWVAASGARVVAPPPNKAEKKLFAAGGAHLITMTI